MVEKISVTLTYAFSNLLNSSEFTDAPILPHTQIATVYHVSELLSTLAEANQGKVPTSLELDTVRDAAEYLGVIQAIDIINTASNQRIYPLNGQPSTSIPTQPENQTRLNYLTMKEKPTTKLIAQTWSSIRKLIYKPQYTISKLGINSVR